MLALLLGFLLAGVLAIPYTEDPNFKPFDTGFKRDRLTRDKQMDGMCTRTVDGVTATVATFKGVLALASDNLIARGIEKTNYLRFFVYSGSPEGQKKGLGLLGMGVTSIMSTQFGTAAAANAYRASTGGEVVTYSPEFNLSLEGDQGLDGNDVAGWIFKPTDHIFVSGNGSSENERRWYDAVGSIPKRYWPKDKEGVPLGSRPSERLIVMIAFRGATAYGARNPSATMKSLQEYLVDNYGTKTITGFTYGAGVDDSTPLFLPEQLETQSKTFACTARLYVDYDSGFEVWTPIFCSIMCAIATVMIIILKCVKRKPSAAVVAETEKLRQATDVSRRSTRASTRSAGEGDSAVAAEQPPQVQEGSS